jgi:hypothetical protein
MITLRVLLAVAATAAVAFCFPDVIKGGVLEKVSTLQVDPTVVSNPEKVKDPAAAKLVRFTLQSAVREAHFAEGSSPIRIHVILDEFSSSDGKVRRVLDLNSGRSDSIVDGKLVVQDATGKELASRVIHFRGNVAFSSADNTDTGGPPRRPASDFEQILIDELQGLK